MLPADMIWFGTGAGLVPSESLSDQEDELEARMSKACNGCDLNVFECVCRCKSVQICIRLRTQCIIVYI